MMRMTIGDWAVVSRIAHRACIRHREWHRCAWSALEQLLDQVLCCSVLWWSTTMDKQFNRGYEDIRVWHDRLVIASGFVRSYQEYAGKHSALQHNTTCYHWNTSHRKVKFGVVALWWINHLTGRHLVMESYDNYLLSCEMVRKHFPVLGDHNLT